MKIAKVEAKKSELANTNPKRISLSGKASSSNQIVNQLEVIITTDGNLTSSVRIPGSSIGLDTASFLINHEFQSFLINEDPRRTDFLYQKITSAFQSPGFAGVTSLAYCAVDFALWNLKAQAANSTIGELLGQSRKSAPFFVSAQGGPDRDIENIMNAAAPLLKNGAKGLVIETGGGDVQADADRVRSAAESVEDDVWVGVNARGRYDLGTAMALAHFFDDQGVGWFEEPLPVTDLDGYSRLANRMETSLAAGASCQTLHELYNLAKSGAVRVLRPDPTRIGGLTPLLKLCAVAEACHCTVVPVRCPEIMEQLAIGIATVPQFEKEVW